MTDDSTIDDMRTNTVDESAPKATMGEFSHSNPYTGETFGDEMAFERGPAVAADGGERNAVSRAARCEASRAVRAADGREQTSSDPRSDGRRADAKENGDEETMEDVDHEHPHEDAADANRVFARGQADPDEDEDEAV